MPELGPVLGKGDAMYRALGAGAVRGEIVCFLDADTSGFSAHYATGLIGPLVCGAPGGREIAFVKAFYERPFEHGGVSLPEGGGRVNRLLAGRRWGCSIRSWPPSDSRSRARSPRAGGCWSACRSRPGTAWRSGC